MSMGAIFFFFNVCVKLFCSILRSNKITFLHNHLMRTLIYIYRQVSAYMMSGLFKQFQLTRERKYEAYTEIIQPFNINKSLPKKHRLSTLQTYHLRKVVHLSQHPFYVSKQSDFWDHHQLLCCVLLNLVHGLKFLFQQTISAGLVQLDFSWNETRFQLD